MGISGAGAFGVVLLVAAAVLVAMSNLAVAQPVNPSSSTVQIQGHAYVALGDGASQVQSGSLVCLITETAEMTQAMNKIANLVTTLGQTASETLSVTSVDLAEMFAKRAAMVAPIYYFPRVANALTRFLNLDVPTRCEPRSRGGFSSSTSL